MSKVTVLTCKCCCKISCLAHIIVYCTPLISVGIILVFCMNNAHPWFVHGLCMVLGGIVFARYTWDLMTHVYYCKHSKLSESIVVFHIAWFCDAEEVLVECVEPLKGGPSLRLFVPAFQVDLPQTVGGKGRFRHEVASLHQLQNFTVLHAWKIIKKPMLIKEALTKHVDSRWYICKKHIQW